MHNPNTITENKMLIAINKKLDTIVDNLAAMQKSVNAFQDRITRLEQWQTETGSPSINNLTSTPNVSFTVPSSSNVSTPNNTPKRIRISTSSSNTDSNVSPTAHAQSTNQSKIINEQNMIIKDQQLQIQKCMDQIQQLANQINGQ